MPNEPLDLDKLERDVPWLYTSGVDVWADTVKALIAELRAARARIAGEDERIADAVAIAVDHYGE